MTKEERTLVIIDRLKKEYPDAGCTLDYNQQPSVQTPESIS